MSEIDMALFALSSIFMAILAMTTASDMLILGTPMSKAEEKAPPNDKLHCRYSKAYSMLKVRCYHPQMDEIPVGLDTDIQILDVSSTRIRELRNDTLAPYTNLAYVYLHDNFIQSIEESAFSQLQYLEVLDLTKNGFDYIPKSVFQLPYLRKFYLGKNRLDDADLTLDSLVTAPLNFLQLHRNKLTQIPAMGYMPWLAYLNVSENMITRITTADLASFCSLQVLDVSKNPLQIYDGSCECVRLRAWITTHNIDFKPVFHCTEVATRHCSNDSFTNETLNLYESCIEIVKMEEEEERARFIWILVAAGVSGFLVCVFLGLYCVHKRNRKKLSLKKEQKRINANHSNTQLLYSNLKAGSNA